MQRKKAEGAKSSETTAMKLNPVTESGKNDQLQFIAELVLAVSLEVGCWYTVMLMAGLQINDGIMIPLLTVLGAGWYILCKKVTLPLWMMFVIPAGAAGVGAFFAMRGELFTASVFLCFAASQIAGYSIAEKKGWPAVAATAVPVIIMLYMKNDTDIWYLGLCLLCWCASFVHAAVNRGFTSSEKRKAGDRIYIRSSRNADFPAWIIMIILAVILAYIFLFTAMGFSSSEAMHTLRAMLNYNEDQIQQFIMDQQNQSTSDSSSSSSDFPWLRFLLMVLVYLLMMIIAAAAAFVIIYQIYMRKKQKDRIRPFGRDITNKTAFAMYGYIEELMAFDGCPVNNNPYVFIEEVQKSGYDKPEGITFEKLADEISRIRFGGEGEFISEDIHRAMAGYCRDIRETVYTRQSGKGKFRMRFIRCYL